MRATCAGPSPGSTPTRASSPGPIAPTVRPSTSTWAWVTRWMSESMERQDSGRGRPRPRHGLPAAGRHRPAARARYTPGVTGSAARLLYWTVAAIARLPWAWLRAMAGVLAWLWRRLDAREARVARRNLELIGPGWPRARRE